MESHPGCNLARGGWGELADDRLEPRHRGEKGISHLHCLRPPLTAFRNQNNGTAHCRALVITLITIFTRDLAVKSPFEMQFNSSRPENASDRPEPREICPRKTPTAGVHSYSEWTGNFDTRATFLSFILLWQLTV